jgi:hypothetical protein
MGTRPWWHRLSSRAFISANALTTGAQLVIFEAMHLTTLIIAAGVVVLSLTVMYCILHGFSFSRTKDRRTGERRLCDRRMTSYEVRVEQAFDELEYLQEKMKVQEERRSDQRRATTERRTRGPKKK